MLKKILLPISIILLLCGACHRDSIQEQCAQMVRHEKRRLPRNVGQGLVLDSMHYDTRDNSLIYYHTMDDSLYSVQAIEANKNNVQGQLQTEINNSVSLKRLKDEGLSFCYVYKSRWDGRELMRLTFRNEDMK